MSKRLGLLLAVALALTMIAPASAQEPVTFIWGSYGDPVQLYAAVVTDGVSFNVVNQGCEALLAFDGSTTNVIPSLATELTANEDATVWTAKLREGVTFQDGTPFNADAVVFNFEAWRFTDNPYHWEANFFEYYDNMFGGFDDASLITSVEAVDDYTVQFNLSDSYAAMPNTLAMPMFQINSPTAIQEHGDLYGTPEVGYVCTGPYRFVEWIPDDHVTMDLWDGYWGEVEGNIERIIYQVIPDNAARFAAIQAGAIHFMENASPEEQAIIESDPNLYMMLRPSLNVLYLAFNYRIEQFRDPLVREAISLAINRQAYADTFFVSAEVANTYTPPMLWGYNPDVPMPEYDPDRAVELLAEAGYPDGFSEVDVLALNEDGTCCTDEVEETIPLTLYWQPVTRPYNPDGEGLGQAEAADLAAVGLEVQLDNGGDWASFLDLGRRGQLLGLYNLGWTGDSGDPDNFSGYFFSQCNQATQGYFDFPEVCGLLTRAKTLTTIEEREPLYQQADALLAEYNGRLAIAHGQVPLVIRSNVTGWVPNPLGTELVRFVSIE
ncbi:MAG: ABC transporter substrate-binding protein [Anaerolineae bacterium]|nr:ABC transporter substrate-binding protein [Anaerolineae bacterium]